MALRATPARDWETDYKPFPSIFDALNNWDNNLVTFTMPRPGGKLGSQFQPSFDLREVEDAYELHGELPGMDKKDINIEFAGPRTILISGKVERSYQLGSPAKQGTAEDGGGESSTSDEALAAAKNGNPPGKAAVGSDKQRTWMAERMVGQFSRTFSFPQDLQQEGSSASLVNGILSLRIPKTGNHKKGRIEIID